MKLRCRQAGDGWQMTFLIPMDSAPADLVMAMEGTKYMLAYAPYTEAEKSPSPDSPVSEGIAPVVDQHGRSSEGSERPATGAAKDRYKAMPPAEQAVVRAAMLPKDREFQEWVADRTAGDWPATEQGATDYIRWWIGCSRSLIAVAPEALAAFLTLETEFLMATGRMASPA